MTPATPRPGAATREALGLAGREGLLDPADLRLIDWLVARAAIADADADALALVTASLCRACSAGSLCLSLDEDELGEGVRTFLSAVGLSGGDSGEAATQAGRFLADAEAGRLATVLGSPGNPRPLMRVRGNLYFHRFWFAEKTVAEELVRLLRHPSPAPSDARIDAVLRETLEANPLRASDGQAIVLAARQREALTHALRERVFILSGGPGTGKTTWTVSWLRAVLRLPGAAPERVRLCAPTGRAAQRLQESLEKYLEGAATNGAADPDAAALRVPAVTLHALLGYQPYTGRFARSPGDPLDAEWVLVDEASMVDLFLLAALVRALPAGARLVLVGDPDQLPPVEAGSVLAELLPPRDGRETDSALPSVSLEQGHRAADALSPLIGAVLAGNPDEALSRLEVSPDPAVAFAEGVPHARLDPESVSLAQTLHAYADAVFHQRSDAGGTYVGWLSRFRRADREEQIRLLPTLWAFSSAARVLAALRRGPVSAASANRILRARLEPEWGRPGDSPGQGFHGAPILITRNDPGTGLSNGEIGLWLENDREAGAPTVFFPRAQSPGEWLRLPAFQLPAHEPGFAVTIHKSQGSEYDAVLVLLPEAGNRLLARETLYTAITRAREAVRVFGSEAAVREAVTRRMARRSGLRGMLEAELRIKNEFP